MAIASWPDRLPAPAVSSYSYKAQAPFVRTSMDSGLARQRRRFISIPTQVSVTWTLDQEHLALLEGFFHYEVVDGAGWFMAKLANGMELQSVRARLIDTYQVELVDKGWWKVAATLETINMPVATPDGYIALRDFGEDVIHRASNDLHRLIHAELPGPLVW